MKRTLITLAVLFGFLALCIVPAHAAAPASYLAPVPSYMFAGTVGHECDPSTQWVWYNSHGTDDQGHNVTCINYTDGRLDTPWLNWVDCPDTGGQHLNFIRTTDPTQITCGTSGPASTVCTNTLTTYHVSTAGNDTTGDGSLALPWLTIQHAIDAGIPGLVCGRYIIQLDQAADRHTQTAVLDGRVFAGGNGGGTSDPSLVQWPISDGNFTPGYSWVEINGDPTVSSTYITGAISVAGGNLILRGITPTGAGSGIGVRIAQAFLSLDAVTVNNFSTNLLCVEGSVCHVDGYDFVDSATCVSCFNFISTSPELDGVEIADDSIFTDYLSDGNNTDSNADSSLAGGSLACLESKFAKVYYRGTIACTPAEGRKGLVGYHSRFVIATLTIDGGSLGTQTGVDLSSSDLAFFGGTGNYTISNVTTGISLDSGSYVDSLPTFAGTTTDWNPHPPSTPNLNSTGTGGYPGGTPVTGGDTQVQFNDGGVFGGDAGLVWDKTAKALAIDSQNLIGGLYAAITVPDGDLTAGSHEVILGQMIVAGTIASDNVAGVGGIVSVTGIKTKTVPSISSLRAWGNTTNGAVINENTGLLVEDQHGIALSNTGVHVKDQGAGVNDRAIQLDGGQSLIPSIATGNSANRDLAGQLTLQAGTKTQASTYFYVSPRICVCSSTAATPLAAQVTNAVASTGAIKASVLNAAGTGYAVGDVGTINGGTGGTYRVDTLAGSGVATYTITAPGTAGYSVAAGVTTTAVPAGGTGFTIDITVIAGIDTLTLTVPGGANTDTYNYICVGRD